MDERFLQQLRWAVAETIRAKHLGVPEQWLLTAGVASPEVEQAFVESVADRLEARLLGCELRPGPAAKVLLN